MAVATNSWWESELAGCTFADARLGQRPKTIVGRMGGAIGASLPFACQDCASTKAAYRFFSNERVSEAEILADHLGATHVRSTATYGTILVLQDTTEFTYQRESPGAIGITYSVNSGKDKAGHLRTHTVCGLLMHSSLVVTTDRLPLGLAAVKFWSRQKFKGTAALNQPDSGAHRAKGKLSMAREHCLIPGFDGAVFSREWEEALWARFSMAAPQRQRQSVERYSIVKRA